MAGPRGLIIAIDGVVGAGKTSAARGLAAALGYRHVDTGAMYRALALAAMRRRVEPEDTGGLVQLLAAARIELEPESEGGAILLDGDDVSEEIRRPEVARRVGAYADKPQVRRALVERQRAMGAEGGVVVDGRDVGTVIFPGADLKVRMTADEEERARRRHLELTAKGVSSSFEEVRSDLRRRDAEDRQRDYAVASCPDATGRTGDADLIEFDTTGLGLDQVIGQLVAWARARGA
ncbi:MAG: (d)CMP kinase [Gemmatimonadota bacterium]